MKIIYQGSKLVFVLFLLTGLNLTAQNINNKLSDEISSPNLKQILNDNVYVYPNPSQEIINVEITGMENEALEIRLSDLYGNLVWNQEMQIEGNINKQININTLPPGAYVLRLVKDLEFMDIKISKM